MSNNLLPVGDNDKETIGGSRDLVLNEIKFATALITPFAAAVAAELSVFGLSKVKIDEIMLLSAKRFGDLAVPERPISGAHEVAGNVKGTGYFQWARSAGGQACDFAASIIGKHGPVLIERLAPLVVDGLAQAVTDFIKGANASSNGTKSKPSSKSRK